MSGADPANGAGTIDVGSSRPLFIDDRFIAEARDVALTMSPPTRHHEPPLVGDRGVVRFRRFRTDILHGEDRDG